MKIINVTADGDYPLTITQITQSPEVSVHVSGTAAAANVALGWLAGDGGFNAYSTGDLKVGESTRVACGEGVQLIGRVTGYSAPFTIEYAN